MRHAISLNHLGRLFMNRGSDNKASEHFAAALHIFESVQNHYYQIRTLVNLCDLSLRTGDFSAVEKYAWKLRESDDREGPYYQHLARFYSITAQTRIAQEEFDKAVEEYLEAFDKALHFNTFLVDEIVSERFEGSMEMLKNTLGLHEAGEFCQRLIEGLEQKVATGAFSDLSKECQGKVEWLKHNLRER